MKYWVQNFDIDGFRCDVAGDVPVTFWDSTRVVLDSIKPMFMLAEAEKPDLLESAFDADYAWKLLGINNNIAKGKQPASDIVGYLNKNDSTLPKDAFKMNFITNHDENSWNGTEFERYGAGAQAFAVLTYTLPGMPLIYTGQEIGSRKSLKFFEKDPIPSWAKNSAFAFYKKLNELKHTQPALKAGLQGGDVKFYRHSAEKSVLYFSRAKEGKEIVVMINLSGKPQTLYSNDVLPKGEFTDFFTGKKITALPKKLAAWEYKVFLTNAL